MKIGQRSRRKNEADDDDVGEKRKRMEGWRENTQDETDVDEKDKAEKEENAKRKKKRIRKTKLMM